MTNSASGTVAAHGLIFDNLELSAGSRLILFLCNFFEMG
jgi:hypothetical protein